MYVCISGARHTKEVTCSLLHFKTKKSNTSLSLMLQEERISGPRELLNNTLTSKFRFYFLTFLRICVFTLVAEVLVCFFWQHLMYPVYLTSIQLFSASLHLSLLLNSIRTRVSIRAGLATAPGHWQLCHNDKDSRQRERGREKRRVYKVGKNKNNSGISAIKNKTGAKQMLRLPLLYEPCIAAVYPRLCCVMDDRQAAFSDHVVLFCSSASEDLGCRRGDFSRKHYGSVELVSPILVYSRSPSVSSLVSAGMDEEQRG